MWKFVCMFLVLMILQGCDSKEKQVGYELVSMSKTSEFLNGDTKEESDKLYGFDVLREYKLGKVTCYTSDTADELPFMCFKNKKQIVFLNSENTTIQLSEKSYLSLRDLNNDGDFDFLSYDIADAKGNLIGTVYDVNMDGEIDWRIIFKAKSAEVFVNGQWLSGLIQKGQNDSIPSFQVLKGSKAELVTWNGFKYSFSKH